VQRLAGGYDVDGVRGEPEAVAEVGQSDDDCGAGRRVEDEADRVLAAADGQGVDPRPAATCLSSALLTASQAPAALLPSPRLRKDQR
jgi:hypothetical protein